MALAMVLVLVLFRYSSPTGPDESRVWGGWVGCVKVGLDGNYFPIRHIFMTCYDLVLFSTLLNARGPPIRSLQYFPMDFDMKLP